MFALILVPNRWKPYIIGLYGLAILITQGPNFLLKNYKKGLFYTAYFILLVISLFYSEDKSRAIRLLGTMSSLFVLPLFFLAHGPQTIKFLFKNEKNCKKVFFYSVLIFNIATFFYYIEHYKFSLLTHYPTLINMGWFAMHPLYLALLINIALLFSFFLIKDEFQKKYILLYALGDLILLFFLLILVKKSPLLNLTVITSLFLFIQMKKSKIKYMLALIMALCFVVIFMPKLNAKFSQLINIQNIKEGPKTSVNIRYSIYPYVFKAINNAPVLGHGIGDASPVLWEKYRMDSEFLYKGQYNSHNQFLGIVLMIGVLGLLLFMIPLIKLLYDSFFMENYTLLLLILLFGMTMLVENILEREAGVIFFGFLIYFYSMFNQKNILK